MTRAFIALDWGTSSFRAYRVGEGGAVLETRSAAAGILTVTDGGFDAAMEQHIGDWDTALPVIATGMITSRQGWVEVPYVRCPAGLTELAAGIVEKRSARGRVLLFVPGLLDEDAAGVPDVMRGEEVQVFGASRGGVEHFIAPGTHSKWITVKDGVIQTFRTYMTGEVYALLRQHSILSRLMNGHDHVDSTFEAGVRAGHAAPAEVLHTVFSARTLPLFNKMPESHVASYLSGLLIGAEVGSAAARADRAAIFTVLATAQLGGLYLQALKLAGLQGKVAADDIVVTGLTRIINARGRA